MKKYMATTGFAPRIEIVECERETDSCVYINGRRRIKISTYQSFFDTFERAKDHIIKYYLYELESSKHSYENAKAKYGNAIGIKDPSQGS